VKSTLIGIGAALGISTQCFAGQFTVKRECVFSIPTLNPVGKICIITGVMEKNGVNFTIETPDAGLYHIRGLTDSQGGSTFLLDGMEASAYGDCYTRSDRQLSICLGDEVK
jgi:hypothetical protein